MENLAQPRSAGEQLGEKEEREDKQQGYRGSSSPCGCGKGGMSRVAGVLPYREVAPDEMWRRGLAGHRATEEDGGEADKKRQRQGGSEKEGFRTSIPFLDAQSPRMQSAERRGEVSPGPYHFKLQERDHTSKPHIQN